MIKEQKIVKAGFCSIGMEGVVCAEKVEKEAGAFVRGTKFGSKEKPSGKCIVCKNEAKETVYISKSY